MQGFYVFLAVCFLIFAVYAVRKDFKKICKGELEQ